MLVGLVCEHCVLIFAFAWLHVICLLFGGLFCFVALFYVGCFACVACVVLWWFCCNGLFVLVFLLIWNMRFVFWFMCLLFVLTLACLMRC